MGKIFTRYSRSISDLDGRGLPMHRSDNPVGVREDTGLHVRSAGKQFYDPSDGSLVGAWLFDEGTGLFVRDHSIYGNHGQIIGPDWVPDGLDFVSGNSDYVNIGTIDLSGDIGFNIWVNIDSVLSDIFVFGEADSGGHGGHFAVGFLTNTSVKIVWNDTTIETITVDALNGSGWRMFTIKRISLGSDNRLTLHDNGVLISDTIETVDIGDFTSEVSIGRVGEYDGLYYDGLVHSVSLYKPFSLTDQVIRNLYAAGIYRRTETMKVSNV